MSRWLGQEGSNTGTERRTAMKKPTATTKSSEADAKPVEIYGNWKVKSVTLEPPTPTIGIEENKSKFEIKDKGTKHVLKKKGNIADVRWDGDKSEIELTDVPTNHVGFGDYKLMAMIKLDGNDYELLLGSEDSGDELLIQLTSVEPEGQPGGSGSAGRIV
jgi:hypothetical protein